MKPREDRRKVLICARMHSGVTWADVCILNMSSRGLGLQAALPPTRGCYVEIRRGAHVIVGRVIWARQHRFGVSTQDVLFVDAIIDQAGTAPASDAETKPREWRARPRTTAALDRSRARARALEFALAVVGGMCLAAVLGGLVQGTLARPLVAISTALARE